MVRAGGGYLILGVQSRKVVLVPLCSYLDSVR